MTLQQGHIPWVHNHAKFEDLLNTSAFISKTSFEPRRDFTSRLSTICPKTKFSRYCGNRYTLVYRGQDVLVTSKIGHILV